MSGVTASPHLGQNVLDRLALVFGLDLVRAVGGHDHRPTDRLIRQWLRQPHQGCPTGTLVAIGALVTEPGRIFDPGPRPGPPEVAVPGATP
jgi:hypothetical protein